jgi:hypothetical protein
LLTATASPSRSSTVLGISERPGAGAGPSREQPTTSVSRVAPLTFVGAIPIPPYQGRRTYFFFADVEPKELMTFGVEPGIPLDDSTLEVLGHALAYWRSLRSRRC